MSANATDTTQFPPGRYGRRREHRPGRRWLVGLIAVLVMALGTAMAVKLYRQYFLAPYQVTVDRVSDVTDRSVTVTFTVDRPHGRAASCTVRARTHDGEEVGRAVITVPAGADRATVTYKLATTKRPFSGEVPGCGPA